MYNFKVVVSGPGVCCYSGVCAHHVGGCGGIVAPISSKKCHTTCKGESKHLYQRNIMLFTSWCLISLEAADQRSPSLSIVHILNINTIQYYSV